MWCNSRSPSWMFSWQKPATTVWCCHANMHQKPWGMLPALCWICANWANLCVLFCLHIFVFYFNSSQMYQHSMPSCHVPCLFLFFFFYLMRFTCVPLYPHLFCIKPSVLPSCPGKEKYQQTYKYSCKSLSNFKKKQPESQNSLNYPTYFELLIHFKDTLIVWISKSWRKLYHCCFHCMGRNVCR